MIAKARPVGVRKTLSRQRSANGRVVRVGSLLMVADGTLGIVEEVGRVVAVRMYLGRDRRGPAVVEFGYSEVTVVLEPSDGVSEEERAELGGSGVRA